MATRHQQSTTNLSNNNVGASKSALKNGPSTQHQEPLVSLRSLTLRNTIVNFDPVRIYNADHAADSRISEEGSAICAWLTGRNVLVSGGSGFLGKVLLEKLLRCCQELGRVFVLVRTKAGKSTDERIHDILDDVVFKKLLRLQPKFKNKVIGINGDVSLPNLGISNEDRTMITKHVSVIFHMAATVNFDATLKKAVDINVRGSAAMLQLGRECGAQLASYVHVSSTYANCTRMTVDERVYEPPMTPDELITLVEQTDSAALEIVKNKILGDHPNTYSFTKCVAETMVAEQSEYMPICIFRPAIVVSTYREPLRGWSNNLHGPTAIFAGAGIGLIRALHCDPDKLADMVPVDMVINCMIAAAYNSHNNRDGATKAPAVYNYVSSMQKPIRWSEICAFMQYYGVETPPAQAMWYLFLRLNKNWLLHWLHLVFLHWVPALLVDGARICIGKEPKLTKLYKKINKFLYVISYFSVKEWLFRNDNVQELWRRLGEADKAAFPFSMDQLDWDEHSQYHVLGLRTYILKEDLATMPQAKKRWKRLYYLHRFVQILTGFFLLITTYVTLAFIYRLF